MKGSSKTPRRRVAAVAIGLGAILASVVPAGLALGQGSVPLSLGVNIESPATLVARGAALSIPLDIVCTNGAEGNVYLNASERVGGSTAVGSGGTTFTCTGTNQVVTVLVQANNGRSFKKGVASVTADAWAYLNLEDQSTYTEKHVSEVVAVVQ